MSLVQTVHFVTEIDQLSVSSMLFLDGPRAIRGGDPQIFRRVPELGAKELEEILKRIAVHIGTALERRGVA